MNPGQLRDRVTLERFTSVRDPSGQPIETWTALATVWASVEPLNGREYFAANEAQSKVTTRIRIRYFAGFTSADRVTQGSTVYDVQSVIDPKSRNEEMVLMCSSSA